MNVAENPKILQLTESGWYDTAAGGSTIDGFPTATTVGVAGIPGWEPETVIEDEEVVFFTDDDAVIEDYQFVNTAVLVLATNVTLRRCEFISNVLQNHDGGPTIFNHMTVEDCTFRNEPDGYTANEIGNAVVSTAGMTLRRCAFDRVTEGIRTGGTDWDLADLTHPLGYGTRLYDCYVGITGPNPCDEFDYHGDCVQSQDTALPGGGTPLLIRNCSFSSLDRYKFDPEEDPPECGGTSCLNNKFGDSLPPDIDGLIMSGAGYCYYMRAGGDHRNMYFVEDSWIYGPVITDEGGWDLVGAWENIKVCTLVDGQPDVITGTIPFGYEGGPFDPP